MSRLPTKWGSVAFMSAAQPAITAQAERANTETANATRGPPVKLRKIDIYPRNQAGTRHPVPSFAQLCCCSAIFQPLQETWGHSALGVVPAGHETQ